MTREVKEANLAAQRQFEAVVTRQIIRDLGAPPRLQHIDVKRLWESHYRVNFWCDDAGVPRLAHSYFAEVSLSGSIVRVDPAIERIYK